MNATAQAGHNMPPPRDAHSLHIDDLLNEARSFLDGKPIETQAQADDVGRLLGKLREARQGADARRKIEAKPYDDGKAEVQAFWKPVIDRTQLAESIAKQALAPFLVEQEAIAEGAAAKAREEAAEAQRRAQEALRGSDTNLADRMTAEALVHAAGKLDRIASKAEKAKPMAAGLGRAVSLRSMWTAVMTDSSAALRHYKQQQPEGLRQWLREQAQRDVHAGARAIPGFTISETRTAQ